MEFGYFDYTGTFLNGKFHGIGSQTQPTFTHWGEYKDNKRHGKGTKYTNEGQVFNMVFENDKEVSCSRVDDPLEAWYGDGLPTTNDDDDTESP